MPGLFGILCSGGLIQILTRLGCHHPAEQADYHVRDRAAAGNLYWR